MTEPDPAEPRAVAERNLCGLVSGAARRIEEQASERAAAVGLTGPRTVEPGELTGPVTMRELRCRVAAGRDG